MEIIESSQILNEQEIDQKIRRIAFEIYEGNFSEKRIVLAGILNKGYQLAKLLKRELKKIAEFEIELVQITIDKKRPDVNEIMLNNDIKSFTGSSIIIVDDVLNTGQTFAYSMKPFLDINVRKLEVAVLVNRGHPRFPISAKYSGYELSTTLKEHIEVNLTPKKKSVTLQ